jgi:glutamate formiminotransferase/formiminotetrahydrofolate cyclodeaminase
MVAVLSHTKKGFEAQQEALDRIAVRGQQLKDAMLAAVDADTAAFDALLDAMRMPKSTAEEETARNTAMATATIGAAEIPLGVLEACPEIIDLNREIARIGMQASLSDAGVGAQAARAAAAGAYQNVCINLAGVSNDDPRKASLLARADTAWDRAKELHALAENEILVKLRADA